MKDVDGRDVDGNGRPLGAPYEGHGKIEDKPSDDKQEGAWADSITKLINDIRTEVKTPFILAKLEILGQIALRDAIRSSVAKPWMPTAERPNFDELALRDEIAKTWGEHGAHAEVYRMLLARLSATVTPERLTLLLGLLSVAKCRACDGSGGIPHQVRDGEWEQEQCQWCDERSQYVPGGK